MVRAEVWARAGCRGDGRGLDRELAPQGVRRGQGACCLRPTAAAATARGWRRPLPSARAPTLMKRVPVSGLTHLQERGREGGQAMR